MIDLIYLEGEDEDGIYSKLMLKAIMADNLYNGVQIISCLSSEWKIDSGKDLIEKLPKRVTVSKVPNEPQGDGMKIAWRYNHLPAETDLTKSLRIQFDFGSFINGDEIEEHNLHEKQIKMNINVKDILDHEADLDSSKKCLLVIERISNELVFGGRDSLEETFFGLKSLTRRHPCLSCLVTLNSQEMTSRSRSRLINMADGVFALDSFQMKSKTYPDFQGLFRIHKLPKVLSLNYPQRLETLDYGFQMRNNQRFLVIQKLSLPPEAEDRPSRSNAPTPSCHSSLLEF